MKEFQRQIGNGFIIERINLSSVGLQEAIKFRKHLQTDIDLGYKIVIVDLSDCNSLDTAFLGVLVITLKQLMRIGGTVKLVKNGVFSDSVLNLTGTIEIFELYDSINSALGSIKDLSQKNISIHESGLDTFSLAHQH
jgi:anti-anti-sigma regulatory factor